MTVTNVAPTVAFTAGPVTVNEGATEYLYSYSISDPGTDTVSSVAVSCGTGGQLVAGSDSNSDTAGSFKCTFPDGPASPTVTVQATDSDNAAGNTASRPVTVTNVAPTVTLTGLDEVVEGSTHTYSFTVSDPGMDTFTLNAGYPTCGLNGTLVAGSLNVTAAGGSFQCTFPDGPASTSVVVKVTDSDGASDTDSEDVLVVAIANVAPTVTAPANQTADEGENKSFNLGSFTDPGPDGPWAVSVDWGDGSTDTTFNQAAPGSLGTASHTYADGPATRTVTVTVTDADNASDAETFSVSVTNVAPTVAFTAGPVTVNEGATEYLYSYSISDPGTDTVSSVAVSCGTGGQLVAGSDSNSDTAGSFKCTFPDGPASPTVTVQATDSDNAAGNTASRPVTVTNVAPTVTLTGLDEVVEGSTHTYSFTVSDPGMDTFTLNAGYPTCGLNGTLVAGSLNVTAAGGSFQCTFPDGPASTSVVVKVTDSDGASDTDSEDVLVVAIANVAPTVTAPANQTADEGENKSFNLGSFTDPGPDGPWAVSVDWGDGSTDTTFNQAAPGSLGTASHTYADGPATRTVTVTVTDADNASDAETFSVSVTNVAPTVAFTAGPVTVNEGATEYLYSYSISDPGTDTVSSVAVSCGTGGQLVAGSDSNSDTAGSFKCTFPDGPASPTVTVQATDSDNAAGNTASRPVTVTNVAPTVTLTGLDEVVEGSTHTYSFTVSDPGMDTFTLNAGYPTCGLNGTLVAGSLNVTAAGGSFQCTFPDGPASTSVVVKVTDSDGASDTDSEDVLVVAIANVAPTVTAPANQTADEGENKSFNLGSFTDPGPDGPWAVSVDWGDGSTDTTFNQAAPGSLGTASHTYADGPATRTVTVTVTDADNASDAETFSVSVTNVAPTVAFSGAASVSEGSLYSLTLGAVTDPGIDTITNYRVHWGDGSFDDYATAGVKTHTYADGPSTRVITVDLTDEDGTFTDAANALSVSVTNVAPTIAISGAASVSEGSLYSLTLGAVTDPGIDTITNYRVHWGDGSFDDYATAGVKTHTYADGPSTRGHHGRPDRRGRHASPSRQRPQRQRHQRRPDDRHLGRRQRQRGLALQPHPGRGHRPRHRHHHQLPRPLGRRQLRRLRHRRRQDPHLRRWPEHPGHHGRPDRRGRHLHRCRQRPQRQRHQRRPDGRNRDRHLRSAHACGDCHGIVHRSRNPGYPYGAGYMERRRVGCDRHVHREFGQRQCDGEDHASHRLLPDPDGNYHRHRQGLRGRLELRSADRRGRCLRRQLPVPDPGQRAEYRQVRKRRSDQGVAHQLMHGGIRPQRDPVRDAHPRPQRRVHR